MGDLRRWRNLSKTELNVILVLQLLTISIPLACVIALLWMLFNNGGSSG